jgi:hypothetical protein
MGGVAQLFPTFPLPVMSSPSEVASASRTPTFVDREAEQRRSRSRSPSPEDFGEEERRVHHEAYPEKQEHDPFIIRFEQDDPDNPKVRITP